MNFFNYKIVSIILLAVIASLGTIPYGFRFAEVLNAYNSHLHLIYLGIGSLLAVTAAVSNAALGTYSLLSFHFQLDKKNIFFMIISIISSISIGFLCYFAYQPIFPFYINVLLALVVSFINAAISYTAINNLTSVSKAKMSYGQNIMQGIGLLIGAIVSLAVYVSTVHGLDQLLIHFYQNQAVMFQLACIIAFITWLPFAALYGNATRQAANKIFVALSEKKKVNHYFSKAEFFILFVALCSGASFAQITKDFFDPSLDIPQFFKPHWVQSFIYNLLVPGAFFSSSIVNYFALSNVYHYYNGNIAQH